MDETPRPAERTGNADLPPDERDLLALWDAHHSRTVWQRLADQNRAAGNHDREAVCIKARDEEPQVTALEALAANRRLVDLLVGRRWYVMQAAREAGASWADIAEAVGYEGELAAMEEYREAIDRQAKYLPDTHDTARAEAALADGPRAGAPVEVVAEATELPCQCRSPRPCYRHGEDQS